MSLVFGLNRNEDGWRNVLEFPNCSLLKFLVVVLQPSKKDLANLH